MSGCAIGDAEALTPPLQVRNVDTSSVSRIPEDHHAQDLAHRRRHCRDHGRHHERIANAADITIRAGLTDPLDTPYGEAMLEFKRIVEEGSNNRIAVQLFPSAQLGAVPEQLENVKVGAQEMALFSPAYAGQFFPAFNVLELPFLVTNWDEAQAMLDSAAFKALTDEAADAIGIKVVGNFPTASATSQQPPPVAAMSDFPMKLRVQNSPVHIAAFQALGAGPVAIGWDETYQAVQTGVVDGLENANTV